VKEYRIRIDADFPSVIEMMTLAISAGETPLSSLERIGKRGTGPLVDELNRVVLDVKRGSPFQHSLDLLGRRVQSAAVRRFVDALVIAISRGAPLIEVLHSQAREAQNLQRNRVLSAAGKSEVSMMIPVVFLILPISILFALWPSLSNLNLFAASYKQ
jgi:tight adherence protein C